jgi:hypothetical protein
VEDRGIGGLRRTDKDVIKCKYTVKSDSPKYATIYPNIIVLTHHLSFPTGVKQFGADVRKCFKCN